MKQSQGTNNGAHEGKTNSEENERLVAHGISSPESNVDLASMTVEYSVYSSCLLLLTSLQLHFMCKENSPLKEKKKKAGYSKEVYPENEKDNYDDDQHQKLDERDTMNWHFIRDYEMYHTEQKRPQLNDQAACPIPLYKKR
ncbi:conserved Plasmodium protein, unknown function [Plasmodium knowlesi strain H]|uniref:Uncharacterized protein n=3 Tax=Plasmodium knowlesi TaxID=5850 RepID=A0A5K1VQ42_PLAKH|nr:conserved Plasmodium protein, unknown function [Plasmodium knowlesi strain H]OTN68293.1 Uncharacterized protein PKNOH_S03329000 [Plasmodium knowlesi]CAA9987192.1 conserved Plasmodium protein, unknown function [Plasmodium knowlesi strain H]SBO23954.1 conserved Plasmodium protein, unknown function [Plasmodium knowlesi strain H]SBO25896.1 conserved Plasmodium protein, unknown function [Plasmodium knowlesi strain H]VVS76666.1 conserved Plasmodium protein, unknown function [Plasmodium knowlesi s|eukprot:XP_002261813.1 hypothetical protein, conserved in Plasmodium species [Plasmodium knowlesi strain H]